MPSDACTCANPAQWLEVACPEHGDQARALIAAAQVAQAQQEEVVIPDPFSPPGMDLAPKERSKWKVRDRWIASLDVQGVPTAQIAEVVGVSDDTIARTRKKDGYELLCRELMESYTKDLVPLMRETLISFLEGAALGARKLVEQLDLEDGEGLPQHGIQHSAAKALTSNPALLKMMSPFLGQEDGEKHSGGATINVIVQKDGAITVGEVPGEEVQDGDWKALEVGDDRADSNPEDEYVAPPEPGDDVGF